MLKALSNNDYKKVKQYMDDGVEFDWKKALKNAINSNQKEMMDILSDNLHDIPVYDRTTFLEQAIKKGNLEFCKILVSKGCRWQFEDERMLLEAIKHNQLHIVKWLIEKGVNINHNNGSMLYEAIDLGYLDIVKILIEEGSINKYGLLSAYELKNLPIINFLREKGFKLEEIPRDILKKNKIEILELMIKHGVKINNAPENYSTLALAVGSENKKMLEMILATGECNLMSIRQALKDAICNKYWDLADYLAQVYVDKLKKDSKQLDKHSLT